MLQRLVRVLPWISTPSVSRGVEILQPEARSVRLHEMVSGVIYLASYVQSVFSASGIVPQKPSALPCRVFNASAFTALSPILCERFSTTSSSLWPLFRRWKADSRAATDANPHLRA